MSIGNAESSINGHLWDGFDVYNDGEANDNLIKNPKIRESGTYLADIEEAEQLFLASLEWKDEATKANLSILHNEVVRNSLNAHLDNIIEAIATEKVDEHIFDARKFTSYVWRKNIWKNEAGENLYENTYSLRLIVEWRGIFNDPNIQEVNSVFKRADQLWIDLGITLEDVAGKMNEALATKKGKLEDIRDDASKINRDFILANWEQYKDFITFTKKHSRRGITPGSIVENGATTDLINNLKTANVDIQDFVDRIEAEKKAEENIQEEQREQEELQEHTQMASLYNSTMSNQSSQLAQNTTPTTTPVQTPTVDSIPDPVTLTQAAPVQVASLGILVLNPKLQDMKDLVANVSFRSNRYNDIYTAHPELVEAIQSMLWVQETGVYDPKTFEAVKAFQNEMKDAGVQMAADGLAGPTTLKIMIENKISATIMVDPNPTNQYTQYNWAGWSNQRINLAP